LKTEAQIENMTEAGNQEDPYRYSKELPADRTNLAQAWKLLESYSKIPASEIDAHVSKVVSNALNSFKALLLPSNIPKSQEGANRKSSAIKHLPSSITHVSVAGVSSIYTLRPPLNTQKLSLVSKPEKPCST